MAIIMKSMDDQQGKEKRQVTMPDHATVKKLHSRNWIRYDFSGGFWDLTSEGKRRLDQWKQNRIANIVVWSRKGRVFYAVDYQSRASSWIHFRHSGKVKRLEPEIVREMIDNGSLQYESKADAWVAPFKSDYVCVQEG